MGASAVYGPQKGATMKQVRLFDQAMDKFARIIEKDYQTTRPSIKSFSEKPFHSVPGAGAAGGLGFAFLLFGTKLLSGAELIAKASNMEEAMKGAILS